jgi:hypothetical protein
MIEKITTSAGEVVTGERLQEALNYVADEQERLAYAVFEKDNYAAHVTQEKKEVNLSQDLEYADQVRKGVAKPSFCLWQRLNTYLTGECVGFLGTKL